MLHWSLSSLAVFFITIVILDSSVNTVTFSSLLCPPDWIYINSSDKCITASLNPGPNAANPEYCKKLNASMIKIESAEENEEIFNKFAKRMIFRFWIAGKTEGLLTDKERHRTVVNLMKSTDYSNWARNSPTCPVGEQCCIMINSYKQWYDIDCFDDLTLTCEKGRIFESSALNQNISIENESLEELSCSESLLRDILSPKNMTLLDDTLVKMSNEIQANRAISRSISTSSFINSTNSSHSASSPATVSLKTMSTSTESIDASSSPKPPMVTVSEELINHIIKRYQKNQLNVIKLWFDLIRTHRNSSERSRQLQRSIDKSNDMTTAASQLSNYLLVILTVLSILALVAAIITLLIIARRFLRQKTQDTYQMSSRLLELGYTAYD